MKSVKTDNILTIFFQNINMVLEKASTLNTTCTIWNIIINSVDLFKGLSQGFPFKGSYLGSLVIGSSLRSSVVGSFLGTWVMGQWYAPQVSKFTFWSLMHFHEDVQDLPQKMRYLFWKHFIICLNNFWDNYLHFSPWKVEFKAALLSH